MDYHQDIPAGGGGVGEGVGGRGVALNKVVVKTKNRFITCVGVLFSFSFFKICLMFNRYTAVILALVAGGCNCRFHCGFQPLRPPIRLGARNRINMAP